MNLSNQAVGALMMALQKSLMEQSDIVPVLLEMDFVQTEDDELHVTNPPVVSLQGVENTSEDTLDNEDATVLIPED
tara:strand:- start:334 stop:561 length:228 start_codon:yes stop_codon:yes gene_type:complete